MKEPRLIQLSENTIWISANANLIFSGNQGILIDTSFSVENLKQIINTLKRLHITNLTILNTHKHYHHANNNKLLLELYPNAKFYTSKRQHLQNIKNDIKLKLVLEEAQNLVLGDGGVNIQVIYSGGHSKDHTMYLVEDDKKIFFTGDILHSISQLYSSIGPIPHIESPSIRLLNQYINSIEIIKKVKPDVICGHTCIGTSGELVDLTVRKTERIMKRIEEIIEEYWCSYLSEQEIARRVFVDLCNELRYNPHLRFSEKLKSGKTAYEEYDLPLLLAMIKKYKHSIES